MFHGTRDMSKQVCTYFITPKCGRLPHSFSIPFLYPCAFTLLYVGGVFIPCDASTTPHPAKFPGFSAFCCYLRRLHFWKNQVCGGQLCWRASNTEMVFFICFYRAVKQRVSSCVNVLGGVSLAAIQPFVLQMLSEFLDEHGLNMPPGPHTTLYRIDMNGSTYYSRKYQRVRKRNSYTIAYLESRKFAFIDCFLHVCNRVIAVLTLLCPVKVTCMHHF